MPIISRSKTIQEAVVTHYPPNKSVDIVLDDKSLAMSIEFLEEVLTFCKSYKDPNE